MATLSSASTDQAVWDEYDDNASYEEDNSLSKAKAFITAVVILLRRQPRRVTTEGLTIEFNPDHYKAELARARAWRSMNDSDRGGSVRHLDFANLRT